MRTRACGRRLVVVVVASLMAFVVASGGAGAGETFEPAPAAGQQRAEARGGGVSVTAFARGGGGRKRGGGVSCPEVRELAPRESGSPPRVVGGCVFEASGEAELLVVSAVAEFVFSDCEVSFTMRVDSRGGLVVNDVAMRGVPPCNDANACFDADGVVKPWGGRLVATAAGALVARVDMCLDTCIGRFAGPFTARLRRDRGGRWWLDSPGRPVGMSGWRFDGGWLLRSGRRIEIGDKRG